MDNQIELEISKLEEIKNRIKTFEDLDHASKVTLERGRLINQTKKVIKLLEKKQDKTDDELKLLDQYYTMLSQVAFTHKRQISERYKKEFIHGEAKVPDVITTLPKAIGLQVRKIATTVNEIKYARGSKAKAAAATNFAKETGLLVATPVIFAGKFLVEHWYLLLLLWGLDREKKRRLKEKEQKGQPQEEPVPETVEEPVTEKVEEPATEAVGEEVMTPDPAVDPTLEPAVATQTVTQDEQAVEEAFKSTAERFQERSNGQVYIKGVSPTNPELVVCNTPEEYLHAICDLCGEDYNMYVDSTGAITKAGYERMIDFNIGHFWQDTRTDPIVFSDPTGQYLDDFVNSGALPKDGLSFYERFETIHCFDSIDSFEKALLDHNPIYDDMRAHFAKCLTVSEAQEGIQCLIDLGLITAGSGAVSWLLGLEPGAMLLADAALLSIAPQGSETLYELFEYIMQLFKTDPSKAVEIFGSPVPVPALGF